MVENAGGDAEGVQLINSAFDDLEAMKRSKVERVGALARSKLAWKFEVLRMSLIYRLADLGEAAIREWCNENTLSSVVLSRAFVETIAMVHWMVKKGLEGMSAGSVAELDALVMTNSFGSKNPDYLKEEGAFEATNVLKMIDSLDRSLQGVRGHYDRLSDVAHPNSFGHHQFYSKIDHDNADVTFSKTKRSRSDMWPSISASAFGCAYAVRKLQQWEEMVRAIADLQAPAAAKEKGPLRALCFALRGPIWSPPLNLRHPPRNRWRVSPASLFCLDDPPANPATPPPSAK